MRKNNEIDILSEQLSKLCFEKEKLEKNLKINDDVVRFIVDLIRNQNLGQNVECSDGKIKENLNECKELVYDLIHNLKVKQEQIDSFELKI